MGESVGVLFVIRQLPLIVPFLNSDTGYDSIDPKDHAGYLFILQNKIEEARIYTQ